MKVMDAIKSKAEYIPANTDIDSMINVIATDRGVDTTATYTQGLAEDTDLCVADIYFHLAQHPKISEGKLGLSVDPKSLRAARASLFYKHGKKPPEFANRPKMTGAKIEW